MTGINMIRPFVEVLTMSSQIMRIIMATITGVTVTRDHILNVRCFIVFKLLSSRGAVNLFLLSSE